MLCALLAFVYWPRVDDKAELDRQIQESWLSGRETADAVEFFEHGGRFAGDETRPAAQDLDQKYVIPLIRTLREKFQLKVMVIVHDEAPNQAFAVLVEAPSDRKLRNEVRATILETADRFPGFLGQYWSHKWVSLEFLDPEIAQGIPPHTQERLKASQRQME